MLFEESVIDGPVGCRWQVPARRYQRRVGALRLADLRHAYKRRPPNISGTPHKRAFSAGIRTWTIGNLPSCLAHRSTGSACDNPSTKASALAYGAPVA